MRILRPILPHWCAGHEQWFQPQGVPSTDRGQRIALLRLLSKYTTYIGPGTFAGGKIYPAFLGRTSVFEVEVDVMPVDKTSPKETYKACVWPKFRRSRWRGRQPGSGSFITIYPPKGERVNSIEVTAKPRELPGSKFDYTLRVRLDLDGGERWYLPGAGKFLENATTEPGTHRDKSTDDVE